MGEPPIPTRLPTATLFRASPVMVAPEPTVFAVTPVTLAPLMAEPDAIWLTVTLAVVCAPVEVTVPARLPTVTPLTVSPVIWAPEPTVLAVTPGTLAPLMAAPEAIWLTAPLGVVCGAGEGTRPARRPRGRLAAPGPA